MKEQTIIISFDRKQLLFLASAIILSGISSNDSTVSPSASRALVAVSVAESLLDSVLQ